MANVDIITILNAGNDSCFTKNGNSLSSPKMISGTTWHKNVWMIGTPVDRVLNNSQGTYNLNVKVNRGDIIRWWEVKVPQHQEGSKYFDLVQYYFDERSGWDQYIKKYGESDGAKQCLASVKRGFDSYSPVFETYKIDVNYVEAKVESSPQSDLTIRYDIWVARVNLADEVEGTYKFDPYITFS